MTIKIRRNWQRLLCILFIVTITGCAQFMEGMKGTAAWPSTSGGGLYTTANTHSVEAVYSAALTTLLQYGFPIQSADKDNGLIITEWVAIGYTPIGGERKWKVQITVGKSSSGRAEFSILGTVGEDRLQIPDGIWQWKYTTRVKGDHPGEWKKMLNIKERILNRVNY